MQTSNHIDTALIGFVDRIVDEHEERDAVSKRITGIYAELREAGFNVTVVRGLVKERRMDPEARNALYQQEEEYRIKLGLLAAMGPLGEAAVQREAAEAARERIPFPTPFAEQPVHEPRRRGRPRKAIEEHLDNARRHLGFDDEAAGSA